MRVDISLHCCSFAVKSAPKSNNESTKDVWHCNPTHIQRENHAFSYMICPVMYFVVYMIALCSHMQYLEGYAANSRRMSNEGSIGMLVCFDGQSFQWVWRCNSCCCANHNCSNVERKNSSQPATMRNGPRWWLVADTNMLCTPHYLVGSGDWKDANIYGEGRTTTTDDWGLIVISSCTKLKFTTLISELL